MAGKGKQSGEKPESGGGKAPKRQTRSNRFNPIANSNARDPTGEGEWTEVAKKDGGGRNKNNDKNGNHQRNGHGQQNQIRSARAVEWPPELNVRNRFPVEFIFFVI